MYPTQKWPPAFIVVSRATYRRGYITGPVTKLKRRQDGIPRKNPCLIVAVMEIVHWEPPVCRFHTHTQNHSRRRGQKTSNVARTSTLYYNNSLAPFLASARTDSLLPVKPKITIAIFFWFLISLSGMSRSSHKQCRARARARRVAGGFGSLFIIFNVQGISLSLFRLKTLSDIYTHGTPQLLV
jgi:hypothetical protein